MTVTVEVGFTEAGNSAPFLTLDDPVKGKLDSEDFVLGGAEVLVDISEFLQGYSINRGKNRELENYNSGQLNIQFENTTRAFDPNFATSPYFGQIVPRRQVRLTNNGIVQFEGTIDDWNLSYTPGGQSLATATAFDGFSNLSQLNISQVTVDEESTSSRIETILDEIGWSQQKRNIEPGGAILGAETIADDINVLQYFGTVGVSEPGDIFVSKNGSVKFVSRNASFQSDGVVFSDAGDGVPYTDVGVVFGSELLFNSVVVTSPAGVANAQDTASIGNYGERDLIRETFLSSQDQLDVLASFLVNRFGEPEFRFETISVNVRQVSEQEQQDLRGLELGDVVEVKLTPSGVPPQVTAYGKIIGIEAQVQPESELMTFKLQSVAGALFVLSDPIFGRLNEGNSLGW